MAKSSQPCPICQKKREAFKRERAEAIVLAVRGSYDAPGFEACVKAEMSEDKPTK